MDFRPVPNEPPPAGVNGHRHRFDPRSGLPSAFKSILVDVDTRADVHHALERAARIAQSCGARLRIVDVVPGTDVRGYRSGADGEDDGACRRRERLARLAETVNGVAVDWDLVAGRAASALVDEVLRSGHDLLMRSHSRDVVSRGPRELREVDVQLFHMCPCPVWAVGYGPVPARPRIVAAIRLSQGESREDPVNTKVIEVAARIAQAEQGSLTLLNAWTAFAERRVRGRIADEDFAAYLDLERRRAEDDLVTLASLSCGGLPRVQVELRRGEPEQVISEHIVGGGVDVLVVGTSARRGIRGLLFRGIAERLLRMVPCSVVAVKRQ